MKNIWSADPINDTMSVSDLLKKKKSAILTAHFTSEKKKNEYCN